MSGGEGGGDGGSDGADGGDGGGDAWVAEPAHAGACAVDPGGAARCPLASSPTAAASAWAIAASTLRAFRPCMRAWMEEAAD